MWLKFTITHGPGHQSRYEEYVYVDGDSISDAAIKESIEEDAWGLLKPWMEDPIIRWERVDSLPKNVRDSYLDKYRRMRESAEFMIKILNTM